MLGDSRGNLHWVALHPQRTFHRQSLDEEEGFRPHRMLYEQALDVVQGSHLQRIHLRPVLEEVEDSYLQPAAYNPVKLIRPSLKRPMMHLHSQKNSSRNWTKVSIP
jgi:hypothetical protein